MARSICTACLVVAFVFIACDTRAYEIDFHYYAVYVLLRSRGYESFVADELATFSQYVDDNSKTEPLYCFASTRAQFHFAGSDRDTATVENIADARAQVAAAFAELSEGGPAAKYKIGAALHLLADTFSHADFTAWQNHQLNCREHSWRPCIGHADAAEKGHAPDFPHHEPAKAVRAAAAIYDLIPIRAGGTVISWQDLEVKLVPVLSLPTASARSEQLHRLAITLFRESSPRYNRLKAQGEKGGFEAAVVR